VRVRRSHQAQRTERLDEKQRTRRRNGGCNKSRSESAKPCRQGNSRVESNEGECVAPEGGLTRNGRERRQTQQTAPQDKSPSEIVGQRTQLVRLRPASRNLSIIRSLSAELRRDAALMVYCLARARCGGPAAALACVGNQDCRLRICRSVRKMPSHSPSPRQVNLGQSPLPGCARASPLCHRHARSSAASPILLQGAASESVGYLVTVAPCAITFEPARISGRRCLCINPSSPVSLESPKMPPPESPDDGQPGL
jgi:hypothetical protein